MRDDLPRGTVTFLFTDIEGSTRLLHELGAERYAEVLGEHQRILRSVFDAHGGREVDTQGDSFFAAFPRAKDAVAAAVDAQRQLAAYSAGGVEVKVRMGLHTGEPVVGDDRYVGMGVHKAARIGAVGHGGQVLLSRSTRELVEDDLPDGVALRDLGERRLKDLERPEQLAQLEVAGLPSEFSPVRTQDVEARRRRRVRLGVLAAFAVVVAAAVALGLGFGRGGGGTGVAPNSVGIVDAASNRVVESIPVGIGPRSVAVGGGAVFVANTADGTVSRIDPATRQVVRTIAVGDFPSDVAVADGAAWVALGGNAQLRRIPLDQNEAENAISALGPTEGFVVQPCSRPWASVVAGGGVLWFACNNDNNSYPLADASRVDPRAGEAVRLEDALVSSSPLGVAFSDIAFGEGEVWLANLSGDAVIQLDARTGLRVRDVAVGARPEAIAVGFGSVWVANAGDGSVSRITIEGGPERPADVRAIPVGREPADVAVGGDAVWVVNRGDGTLSRIDPKTSEVVATVRVGSRLERAAVGDGLVWVTVQAEEAGDAEP